MATNDQLVLRQVADQLGHYVYALIDPRDGVPFYVGKGQGARMLQHGRDAARLSSSDEEGAEEASRKLERIAEIRSGGIEPIIWVIRYGLSAQEYTAVEATAIDLLMSLPIVSSGLRRVPLAEAGQLTNARREAARSAGIVTLDQLVSDLAAPPLKSTAPLVLITARSWTDLEERVPGGAIRPGVGFKRAWLDPVIRRAEIGALGDSIRAWWRISQGSVEKRRIEYAVAVYGGVTRGLFRIVPGSWEAHPENPQRRGFRTEPIVDGPLFDEVVGPLGHRVPQRRKGDQSEFHYWPR